MFPILLLALVIGSAAVGGLFAFFVVVPYWSAERRGRARWRDAPAVPPSEHPYRAMHMVRRARRAEAPRAPGLVRAAAMVSFLWAWACLAWAIVVALDLRAAGESIGALMVVPPLVGAFFVQRVARRLLERHEHALSLVRPLVVAQTAHAAVLIGFGLVAERVGVDAFVADLTIALGIGAGLQAAVIHAATRAHAAAFDPRDAAYDRRARVAK